MLQDCCPFANIFPLVTAVQTTTQVFVPRLSYHHLSVRCISINRFMQELYDSSGLIILLWIYIEWLSNRADRRHGIKENVCPLPIPTSPAPHRSLPDPPATTSTTPQPSPQPPPNIMKLIIIPVLVSLLFAAAQAGKCSACATENFDLLNAFRVSKGRDEITYSVKLARVAIKHSKYMFKNNKFEHSADLPLSQSENIASASFAYDFTTVAAGFHNQWRKSKVHKANMLRRTAVCVGVGIFGNSDMQLGTQIFSADPADC